MAVGFKWGMVLFTSVIIACRSVVGLSFTTTALASGLEPVSTFAMSNKAVNPLSVFRPFLSIV